MFNTLAEGANAVVTAPYSAVKKAFSAVRKLLPFSDAQEGPLANLTASGQALIETLASAMHRVGKLQAPIFARIWGLCWPMIAVLISARPLHQRRHLCLQEVPPARALGAPLSRESGCERMVYLPIRFRHKSPGRAHLGFRSPCRHFHLHPLPSSILLVVWADQRPVGVIRDHSKPRPNVCLSTIAGSL